MPKYTAAIGSTLTANQTTHIYSYNAPVVEIIKGDKYKVLSSPKTNYYKIKHLKSGREYVILDEDLYHVTKPKALSKRAGMSEKHFGALSRSAATRVTDLAAKYLTKWNMATKLAKEAIADLGQVKMGSDVEAFSNSADVLLDAVAVKLWSLKDLIKELDRLQKGTTNAIMELDGEIVREQEGDDRFMSKRERLAKQASALLRRSINKK